MLLDEYCPLMQNTEKRIRLRTKCFEAYEELCKTRQYILMLPPSVDLGQQVIPVIVPSSELLKQADNILPPLFAPLTGGGANIQPLIIKAPAIKLIEAPASLALPTLTQAAAATTTTTTTTTTSTTTTTTPAPIISGNSVNSLLASPTVKSLKQLVAPDTMNETNDNETLHQSYEMQTTTEHVKIIEEVTKKLPPTNEVPLEGAEGLSGDNISTQKPSILVVNIDDADASNVASNPVVDSEYATVVEYIPNPEKSSPQVVETEPPQPPPPDVLIDEDSKSNAIHEEYHTKILADYGSAPQNLLQPDEPPENP